MSITPRCRITDCVGLGKLNKNGKRYLIKGYCAVHSQRLYRTGDPLKVRDKIVNKAVVRKKKLFELLELETDKCIDWPFPVTSGGYGYIKVTDKIQYTHRIALEHRYGAESGTGKMALHKPLICHNRACINYRHLYWGTVKDNSKDSIIDETTLKGEKHPRAKLKREQVILLMKDTRSNSEVAKELGVTRESVRDIRLGKNWSWLTGVPYGKS